MAKNILKEAIADAKAVREVALANAKAALEEAFTPKLQSMLSAKLSETLNEEEEDLDEMYEDKEEVSEMYEEEDTMDETTGMEDEGENLDEEIDLEEILNELELEETEDSKEETVDEGEDADEDTVDEAKDDKGEEVEEGFQSKPSAAADDVQNVTYKSDYIYEDKDFDLDSLLEEINNLDENEEEMEEGSFSGRTFGSTPRFDKNADPKKYDNMQYPNAMKDKKLDPQWSGYQDLENHLVKYYMGKAAIKFPDSWATMDDGAKKKYATDHMNKVHHIQLDKWKGEFEKAGVNEGEDVSNADADNMKDPATMKERAQMQSFEEVKAALEVKTSELNEVNLLNSKLLYVNRIFKANNLDEGQKLRVVETLDNAETIKEAKLIYETIKDTFNVAKSKKASFKTKTKSLKEGIGMASKAAGTSTAPKKEILSESNDMMARFQKLANIKINN